MGTASTKGTPDHQVCKDICDICFGIATISKPLLCKTLLQTILQWLCLFVCFFFHGVEALFSQIFIVAAQ